MGDVSAALRRYINEEIRLSRTDISTSAASRDWLLERIKRKIEEQRNSLILYKDSPFVYFGSYFKGTKVKSVDEYDVLVVIDSCQGQYSSGGVEIGTGIGYANPNHKYDDQFFKSDGSGVSPGKILNWLKRIVLDVVTGFGGEAPERNGQAITARIKSKDVAIDLVPAGVFVKNNKSIFYNIPRGDAGNNWIETAPSVDKYRLEQAAYGKPDLKNIIRIVKNVKDCYNFLVPSFAIETSVVDYAFSGSWTNNIAQDTYNSLCHISSAFSSGKIIDRYSGSNLIAEITALDWYSSRINNILSNIVDAATLGSQEDVYIAIKNTLENT